MSGNSSNHGEPGGPIAYMASNGVAANLLMFGIIAAGLVSLTGLEQEGWPEVPFNQFEISVPFPGATPEEVEEAIVVKIEDEVRGLADVKAVRSIAAPGMASVRVEVNSGTDMGAKKDEIESA
ncbi:MAG: efflux RND transporter permease subunit, partial [Gemmatimonadetes bacterium]|nr:efflux RND transporter permease subunit [Gemmatimonadota bacterium]